MRRYRSVFTIQGRLFLSWYVLLGKKSKYKSIALDMYFTSMCLEGTVLNYYDSNMAKVELHVNKKRYKIKTHMVMKMVEEASLSVSFFFDISLRAVDV
jgi:hypothetical protein